MKKGSIKYLIIQTLLIIIFGMILYPLFDLIIYKFFTHSEFVYSVKSYIVDPIIYGTILGLVFWIIDKRSISKKGE